MLIDPATGQTAAVGTVIFRRADNQKRSAQVVFLVANSGLIVLVTLTSPKEADRQMAKEIIGDELFSLVYVDTPLEVCEQRDPKGLYKKARAGEIPNFTGIGAEFEEVTRYFSSSAP